VELISITVTGLAFAAGLYLRQHYLTPLVASNLNVPGSAWIVIRWWTKGGKFAFAGQPPLSLLQQSCPPPGSGLGHPKSSGAAIASIARCLSQHGYTQWDQLSAGQPVLAIPMDRERLAARAVPAAHRHHHLAGPSPRCLKHWQPVNLAAHRSSHSRVTKTARPARSPPRSAGRRALIWPNDHIASVPAIMGIHGTTASVP
jgi:hypothetical protein